MAAIQHPSSKDPTPIRTEKPSALISVAEKKRLSTQIDGLFKNRPTANDMYMRGIIDWNPDDAVEVGDYETFRHYKEDNLREISEKLNRRISSKFRPSKTDLELRGIVPVGAFDDSTSAAEDRDMAHNIRNITLARFIGNRPNPDEMRNSKIFQPGDDKDFWGHEDKRDRIKRASMDLTWRFGQRSPLEDLVARGIVPPEYARTIMGNQESKQAEQAASRRSRIQREKLHMRFQNRAEPQHVLARGIVDPEYLYNDASVVQMSKRKSKLETADALSGMLKRLKGIQQQAVAAAVDADRYISEHLAAQGNGQLGPPSLQDRIKRASVDLEWRYGERQELDELIQRGIVNPAFKDVLHGEKDISEAMDEQKIEAERIRARVERQVNDRMMPDEAIARGYVGKDDLQKDYDSVQKEKKKTRRQLEKELGSLVAARPHATALQEVGITYPADIAPLPSPSPAPSPGPPDVLMQRQIADNADRIAYEERRQEYNARKIPPSISTNVAGNGNYNDMSAMTPTGRPRMIKEKSLNAFISPHGRPSKTDLVERGIVPAGYWDNPKNAVLQKQISRDQARINFEAVFRTRDDIQQLVARGLIRQEYLENSNPKEVEKMIASQKLKFSKALKQKLDPKIRLTPEEMQARGFVPYRVGQDSVDKQLSVIDRIHQERESIGVSLDSKLHPKRRPSFQALQARGIVPIYWYDPDESNYTVDGQALLANAGRTPPGRVNIEIHAPNADGTYNMDDVGRTGPGSYGHGRRMSKATAFETMFDQLKKKPELMEEMAEKLLMDQLVRAGHMDGEDIAKLEERKHKKKKLIRKKLNRRLSRDFRPSPAELEKRNIVPAGYWTDMKKAFSKQHRRRKTAENDLGEKLSNRLKPAALVERGYASEDFMKMVYNGSRDAPVMGGANMMGVRVSRSTSPVLEEEKVAPKTRELSNNPSTPLNPPPLPASTSVKQMMNRHLDGDWQSAVLNYEPSATTPGLMDDSSELLFGSGMTPRAPNDPLSIEFSQLTSSDAWNELRESLVNSLQFLSLYEAIMFGIRSRKEELDYLSDVIDNNDNTMRHTRSASQAATIRDAAQHANEKQIRYENEVEKLQHLFVDVRTFEDAFLDKMNTFLCQKKSILENKQEYEQRFSQSCEFMKLMSENQSTIVNKINVNMRITMRKIRSLEDAIKRMGGDLNDKRKEKMNSDLQFQKYIFSDYQRMLDEMSANRRKICEEIDESDEKVNYWTEKLNEVNEEMRKYERESWMILDDFKSMLPVQVGEEEVVSKKKKGHSSATDDDEEKKTKDALNIRIEHRDDVSDLEVAVKYRTKKIENDLKVLEKRTSHLNTYKYVRRINEIVELQMILKSANLKKFYEQFVKKVNVAFTEISYAHTVFEKTVGKVENGNNVSVNWMNKKEGIAELETVKYIASITPGDVKNEVSYEKTLMNICAEMQSYICSLPDRDAVIYHVARHLTSHRIRRAEIEQIESDEEMDKLVSQRVHEWIRALLNETYGMEETRSVVTRVAVRKNDLVRSESVTSDSFGLIAASMRDILAQVRTSRAASIVLNRVYGIHLDI